MTALRDGPTQPPAAPPSEPEERNEEMRGLVEDAFTAWYDAACSEDYGTRSRLIDEATKAQVRAMAALVWPSPAAPPVAPPVCSECEVNRARASRAEAERDAALESAAKHHALNDRLRVRLARHGHVFDAEPPCPVCIGIEPAAPPVAPEPTQHMGHVAAVTVTAEGSRRAPAEEPAPATPPREPPAAPPAPGEVERLRTALHRLVYAVCRVGDWSDGSRVGDAIDEAEAALAAEPTSAPVRDDDRDLALRYASLRRGDEVFVPGEGWTGRAAIEAAIRADERRRTLLALAALCDAHERDPFYTTAHDQSRWLAAMLRLMADGRRGLDGLEPRTEPTT